MPTIPHRELRNRSSEILRRVEAGETFEITNRGRSVARLIPTGQSPLEALRRAGRTRPAQRVDVSGLAREFAVGSREILDDERGES